jgi:galactose oxidase
MGVLLQGFYKLPNPTRAVPSPADGDNTVPWWWDHLASQANALRQVGFSAVWLPPVLKTSEGASKGADGYGPFDDYDIGSKNQPDGPKRSIPTRFGSREKLQRCIATLHANGIDAYLDMVEHHRDGDPKNKPFVFRYLGADGVANAGRFPKNPLNFVPNVPRDPDLGGPPQDDFPFGRELAPINAQPKNYIFNGLIDAADWLTRALGVQGYRIDDVKGLSTDFLFPFLNSKSMQGKFAFGEYFDGNTTLVNGWLFNPHGMRGRASAFDFPLRFILQAMCNNPGRFNMADLDHAGVAGTAPLNAVTFVENHDTDLTSPVIFNKLLGYAYILTSEGYPCIYYRDYSTDQNCFGLKPSVDNLIWIHEKLAGGSTQQRWKDFNLFAYERLGQPGLLVALNNDPNNARTITVATSFGPNVALHDYTGHAQDTVTNAQGSVTIIVPRNADGHGYVCYSRTGINGAFAVQTHATTQDFEGAADLDISPAQSGQLITVGNVWCEQGTPIAAGLSVPGLSGATEVEVDIVGPDDITLASKAFASRLPLPPINATTAKRGFHSLRLKTTNSPAALSLDYKLSVTYTGVTQLLANEASASNDVAQVGNPKEVGQWGAVFELPNVPIHTHVLPTGKVLFWGRRNPPGTTPETANFPSLNQHATQALIWDPANPDTPARPTSNQPTNSNGQFINLFCSGHTFMPDGRLLVTGGHIFDSQGISSATFYDPFKDRWSPGPDMGTGRWYPTAVTLPEGRAFVLSGSHAVGTPAPPPKNFNTLTNIPQILDNGQWANVTDFEGLPLFPRLHVAPNGFLFMSGPLATSFFLKNFESQNTNAWAPVGARAAAFRDYAPSVMYDVGKVIFIGGGLDGDNDLPTNIVEIIDLQAPNPTWVKSAPMKVPRRQHNATLLPDGTVLVTGGTQGAGFDNLNDGQPVHTPELWDPSNGTWTQMAPEQIDRCYHSTAVLLPDGRVFSGGGGEYAPDPTVQKSNPPSGTHSNAQLFSPPYLFKGERPTITKAPTQVTYGEAFDVETPVPTEISQITWIRLPSVTHSFDQNQRINSLNFRTVVSKLTVTAPPNANVCPPGHYMLFLLNQAKVPSEASIIQIAGAAGAEIPIETTAHIAAASRSPVAFRAPAQKPPSPIDKDAAIELAEKKPAVVVGITPTCPYGLSACWSGAYEALKHLRGVRLVRPVPNVEDSTGFVYLKHDGLPDIDAWPAEFASIANGVHRFRGVEITLTVILQIKQGNALVMQGNDIRPSVLLEAMEPADKIQWDAAKGSTRPLDPIEQNAYSRLQQKVKDAGGSLEATVTGPVQRSGTEYVLKVREFSVS